VTIGRFSDLPNNGGHRCPPAPQQPLRLWFNKAEPASINSLRSLLSRPTSRLSRRPTAGRTHMTFGFIKRSIHLFPPESWSLFDPPPVCQPEHDFHLVLLWTTTPPTAPPHSSLPQVPALWTKILLFPFSSVLNPEDRRVNRDLENCRNLTIHDHPEIAITSNSLPPPTATGIIPIDRPADLPPAEKTAGGE